MPTDAEPSAETRVRAVAARERAGALTAAHDERLTAAMELISEQARELSALRAKVVHLEIALRTSRLIGQAIGIVMAQNKITEDEAFRLLRDVSQRSHRKLRELADVVVLTGEIPTVAA